ncbi:TonB-dependent receptor [Parabacteroides sp. OttesenSCG-928-G06]|nr:TonB-dependent receptor [Parabacteroides sp. OttesenSCG-928-G06]
MCLLCIGTIAKAQITVTGTVTDETNEPVIGANISLKGTTTGGTTDFNGHYSINVPNQNAVIVFSYLGYATQEITVGARTILNVQMKEDSKILGEVVVSVGFGTQKKVNLTGAVSAVSAEALENKPVANLGQALEGVIPNLNISGVNANPSAAPSFNVRGGTSMSYNSSNSKWEINTGSPLILVDGIEMDATAVNMMNPNNIESISVLKDAAASAIYGARATYGVMLIITKSGSHNQKAKVDYSFNIQWNTPANTPDIMDSYTHQLAKNEATLLTHGTVTPWNETLLAAKKKYIENPTPENAWIYNEGSTSAFTWVANVNPYKLAVRDWTPMQNHTLNVSGGTDKTRYYVSFGFQRQEGMYKINTDNQNRYNGMVNLDTEITKWFKIGTKITYNTSTYKEPYMNPQKGSLWSAMKNEPERNINQPMMSGSNDPIPNTWSDNIVGWLAYGATQDTRRTNMLVNVNPTITIMPGLQLKAELSYRPTEYFQKRVIPTREYLSGNWNTLITTHTNPSKVVEQTSHSDLFTINAYANFNKTYGKHAINGVAGFNQEWYKYRYMSAEGQNILTNGMPVINGTTGNQYAGDNWSHWAVRGAFFRAGYIYSDRYLFEFNGRYDGTSRFGKDSRFKFFPSASAGWRISEESFMENTRSWLDNLKIRGSWGSLGNQNVANYAYVAEYGSVSYVSYDMGGSRPMGITPPGLISPDLTWETATTIDFGVDFTMLNNRLDATFDWYQRKTTDILMDAATYPAVLGASAPRVNSGTLKTNGWELGIKWRDRLSNGIRYDVGLTLSDYLTKVDKFDGNGIFNEETKQWENQLLSSLYTGMTMGEIWGYETAGILQESDFTVENGKYTLNGPSQTKTGYSTWYPGDIRYKDANGDGEVTPGASTVQDSGDRRIIGNNTPRFKFGISGNISWKNFDLSLLFQGIAKRDLWISDTAFWGNPGTAGNMELYNNSWTPERTNAKYPMYADRAQNRLVQTGYLFNGAYLRLKTLSVGYTLPKELLKKIQLQNVRVSASGYNLFEITNVPKVLDPDLVSSSYPMMRSVAFNLQIGF